MMPVQLAPWNRHNPRGDELMGKTEKTYEIGNSVIKIIAPKSIPEKEKEQILNNLYRIGREILKKREVKNE